jgi:hypothetical protein
MTAIRILRVRKRNAFLHDNSAAHSLCHYLACCVHTKPKQYASHTDDNTKHNESARYQWLFVPYTPPVHYTQHPYSFEQKHTYCFEKHNAVLLLFVFLNKRLQARLLLPIALHKVITRAISTGIDALLLERCTRRVLVCDDAGSSKRCEEKDDNSVR